MHRAATGLVAGVLYGKPGGARIRVRAPCHRLAFGVGSQILTLKVAQFVERKIRGLEARATLQADNLHAGLAELGPDNAADRAHTDDDHIRLFDCHVRSSLVSLPTA